MATGVFAPKSPRQLYRLAKQKSWDPEEIPVAEDRADWERLTAGQKEQLLKVCALFYEGEVSVSDTLAWFMAAMPDPDRRIFLASQILEEVKHAEFFERYFREVLGKVDTSAYLVPEYKGVLLDELRERSEAIGRALLSRDTEAAEEALVIGVAHYMGVIEGVLAVGGYEYFEEMLAQRKIFPRLMEGIRLIRIDEGRHIVHGMDFLREKIEQKPKYAAAVQKLFFEEGLKVPARTDVVFTPNDFELDRAKMMAMGYRNLQQRAEEAGVA